ncbi:MAG: hypothetical protein AAGF33_09560 [Pseudomonadota bacterium]
MNNYSLALVAVAVLLPSTSNAKGLVPTMERDFEFCQDRPAQPDWIETLPVREAYKGLVIQTIYRAQSVERVVTAGECSCDTRFPAWDGAVQHFNDRYLSGDRNELREANTTYLERFNELRTAARTICEQEGHW